MGNKEYVTEFTLFSSIVVTIVGVGIFSYPRELAEVVGTDGWIIVIISGLICLGILYFANYLIKINNYQSLSEIIINNTGKAIGSILLLIFAALGIFTAAIGMRVFTEVLKMYLLDKTPTEFILITLILTCMYLLRKDIETLGKFNEVSFWIMFVPIIFILLALCKIFDYTNIFPIMHNKPMTYVKSLSKSIYSFSGIEIVYLFIPLMKNKEKAVKACTKAVVFITIFYVITFLSALFVFPKDALKQILWPTIGMIKCIDIPGKFIERWDGIAMALWVIFSFTTFVNIISLSENIVKDVFNFSSVKISLYFIVPIIYVLALYPDNITQISNITGMFEPILTFLAYIIIPAIILLICLIRKRGIKKCEK